MSTTTTKTLTSAGIVLYCKKQGTPYFLLLCHSKGKHWDFPKGKIEQGETVKEAALRELEEETGLIAQVHPDFLETISYWLREKEFLIHKKVFFFIGTISDIAQVTLSREHCDYKWVPFTQAYEQLTYENAKEILLKAQRYIKAAEMIEQSSAIK
jgi:bis(5'-nucleosidyl)-tetraphosphatase